MSLLSLPQLLRRHSECPVEFTRSVFPSDRGGQLHDLIVVIVATQPGEKLVVNVIVRNRHSIGELERSAFRIGIQRAARVIVQRVDLLI